MLLKICEFIQEQQVVSVSQIEQHFQIEGSALEPMLALLIQRHDIQEVIPDFCQQECKACDQPMYYQWVKPQT